MPLSILKQEIATTQSLMVIHKRDFAEFINDTSVSLEVRWKLFTESPSWLKEAEGWVSNFYWERLYGELNWYDDFGYARYTTVDMHQVVETMEESDKYSDVSIKSMKEEILSKNLGSFII